MKINCFIPFQSNEQVQQTVAELKQSPLVHNIYLLCSPLGNASLNEALSGCKVIKVDNLTSSATMADIAQQSDADFSLIYTKYTSLRLGQYALERLCRIASDTAAGMVYSDYYQVVNGVSSPLPVNDYQLGSIRDDFNFGSVLLFNAELLKKTVANTSAQYLYAGLYNVRLKVSQYSELVHINEFLYSEVEDDTRKSGEKQFDYVDPKNRAVQIDMETDCTDHLKETGVYLAPQFKQINFNDSNFEYEASVIIPVKNRVKTLGDAIASVLKQKTSFKFNLIIVDNYSTDGTTELIENYANKDNRVIHVIPENKTLGIGGCWNAGVDRPECGKFTVQLDSDDVYENENTLQTMVNAFYEQNCAMVVGSYTMTNFAMEVIPPGLIDHKEWTPDNGRNNALRINGLGAPRAFYTPLLREIKVPNTSYGEDYALGLRFSREYQIGRVYQSVYFCRRWEGNSDAALDIVKLNANNAYKDKIRSIEMMARKK